MKLAMKRAMKRLVAALCAAVVVGPALAADKLRIGFVSTLSGPTATIGGDIRDGFALAIKQNGGKLGGLPVEMTISDDQLRPEIGKQAVTRFLQVDKVDIVTGTSFSNVLASIVPDVVGAGRFFIAPNAGISQFAGAGCHPNLFFTSWPTEAYAEAGGQFVTSREFKRVAFIAPNVPGGRDTATGFKRYYKPELVAEIYAKLGQLDYSAELTQIRVAKPDAIYAFLPGGMGINFVKQFVAAGLSKDMQLVVPMWGSDQDVVNAVGDSMLGLFSVGHWTIDFPNDANRKFVAAFEAEYKRLPTSYAASAYDTAQLIDSAVRKVRGRIEDKDAFRQALRAADFKSVRGEFRFGANQFPVQNYYLQVVSRDAQGRLVHKTLGTILKSRADAYVQDCRMK